MKTRSAFALVVGLSLCLSLPLQAANVQLRAAGNYGAAYVGLLYGLVNPATGAWYEGQDLFGGASTTWQVVADTGSSTCLMGVSTQDAYGTAAGLPYQPGVTFSDIGFGGSEVFDVIGPVQMRVAGQRQAINDSENHSLYSPVGLPNMRMAALNSAEP